MGEPDATKTLEERVDDLEEEVRILTKVVEDLQSLLHRALETLPHVCPSRGRPHRDLERRETLARRAERRTQSQRPPRQGDPPGARTWRRLRDAAEMVRRDGL